MKSRFNNDTERNNYVGMLTHLAVVVLMLLLACLRTAQGGIKPMLLGIYFILGLGPNILELLSWKKDHKTPMIKHYLAIGYAIFYTAYLFCSANFIVFMFVVPLIVIITIYNDNKYSLMINSGVVIEVILVNVIGLKYGKYGINSSDTAAISIMSIILMALFSLVAAQIINKNLSDKISVITDVAKHTEEGIEDINRDLQLLSESSANTKSAMNEVNSGTANVADAVQNQLLQTQQIDDRVSTVNTSADQMSGNLNKTLECVEVGNRQIEKLASQVDASVAVSEEAIKKLDNLTGSMHEMNKIVRLIDDIAFQTNILALNANVEAARAGEAGSGFAVVAGEVSAMSVRTKEATANIQEMIANVSSSIEDVVGVIDQMAAGIKEEKKCSSDASSAFEDISVNADHMQQSLNELINNLGVLIKANQEISDSISVISSITEEVSALADEAMSSEEKNSEVVDTVYTKMQMLLGEVNDKEV